MMDGIRINLMELGHSGHQRQHLLNVIRGWNSHSQSSWSMRVTVSNDLLEIHPDIAEAVADHAQRGVELEILAADVATRLKNAEFIDRVPLSWIYPPGPPDTSPA